VDADYIADMRTWGTARGSRELVESRTTRGSRVCEVAKESRVHSLITCRSCAEPAIHGVTKKLHSPRKRAIRGELSLSEIIRAQGRGSDLLR